MKALNILLIVLLFAYLALGGYTMYHIHNYYNTEYIPAKVYSRIFYPFELFEAICLAVIIYCLVKFRKQQYTIVMYVAFTVIILSALFFHFMKR